MNKTQSPHSRLANLAALSLRADVAKVPAAQLARGLVARVIWMRPHMRALIFALALAAAIFGLFGPYFQKQFVDELLASGQSKADFGSLATWISLAFVTLIASQGFTALLRLVCSREALLVNRWLANQLYSHMMHLGHGSRRSHTVGELVSIYAQDIASTVALVDELLPTLMTSVIPLIVGPLAVGLYFDIPLMPLGLVTAASLVLLFFLSLRQSHFFALYKSLAAERLAVVNEWLQNIRIIRILGWTSAFEANIFKHREQETDNRVRMVTNGSTMNAYAQAAPGLISVTGIASIVLTQVDVTPGEIFALLWVLSVFLARPLRSVPWNIVIYLDGLTSCRRIEKIFALATESSEQNSHALDSRPRTPKDASPTPSTDHALAISGLELVLNGETLLHDLSLTVKKGELVAIVGEVGAGKTLLLDSLLREAPARFASYTVYGENALAMNLGQLRAHFSYVPQDSFVISSTLRDNIAFEYDSPAQLDEPVTHSLQLASFDPSEETLVAGLETEIGERGVNLSGGQRQRINLSRAHFTSRPIILLDDCLSAVDVETERRLLEDLIEGAWKKSTRLLVTHRLSVLPRVDRILVMHKGRFVAEGNFEQLMSTSETFRQITRSLGKTPAVAAATSFGGQP